MYSPAAQLLLARGTRARNATQKSYMHPKYVTKIPSKMEIRNHQERWSDKIYEHLILAARNLGHSFVLQN
jgi:hypothetical protein